MPISLQVGTIRCHILSDGISVMDGGGFFGVVPRIMWQQIIQPNELNQIPTDNRSLLIESESGRILVDTGYGDKLSARQRQIFRLGDRTDRLLNDMQRAGFAPEDIDLVILTHLHGDHVGGATRWADPNQPDSGIVPTFPNARYLVQRIDLADASFPNERTASTFHSHNWLALQASGQLEVVDGPQRIDRFVRTDVTPGHTAAIQTVWVEAGEESLLFLGDACSWAVHMERLAWVPAFDIFPITSMETKRRLRMEAMERNTLLLFQHDSQVITGRLVEGPRGPQVQPELTKAAWDDLSVG